MNNELVYLNTPTKENLKSLVGKELTIKELSQYEKCYKDIDDIIESVDEFKSVDLDNLDGYIPGVEVEVLTQGELTPDTRLLIKDYYIDS